MRWLAQTLVGAALVGFVTAWLYRSGRDDEASESALEIWNAERRADRANERADQALAASVKAIDRMAAADADCQAAMEANEALVLVLKQHLPGIDVSDFLPVHRAG